MEDPNAQIKFLLSDFNTRLRDLDERNKLIRERVLLLGKNLISSRQDMEEEVKEIKQDNITIKQELEKLTRTTSALLTEFNKFVKRDELAVVERMLRDFQPLDFVRKKDLQN
jgi:predicted  nucleic acid-binding Zn-ribbon protein